MDDRRERLHREKQLKEFRFKIGDLVDVFDHGLSWEARVRRIILNATDNRVRYQCSFKGHRQWDEVVWFQHKSHYVLLRVVEQCNVAHLLIQITAIQF